MGLSIRSILAGGCPTTPRDRANSRSLTWVSLTWVLSWLGLGLAIDNGLIEKGVVANLLTLIPFGIGIAAGYAYRRFLRETDELHRKIELDALAAAFGVGLIGGLSLWTFVQTGMIETADPMWLVMGMIVTYTLSVLVGRARYA